MQHVLPTPLSIRNPNQVVQAIVRLSLMVPVTWVLGVDFLFPFLALLVMPFKLHKFSVEEVAILFLAIWLSISLSVSGISSFPRVLAAYYSVSLLVAFVFVSQSFRCSIEGLDDNSIFELSKKLFGKILFYCALFVFAGLTIGFVFGIMRFSFPTVLGMVSPIDLPGIAERSMLAEVIRPDWGFGSFAMPRPLVFAPWYTAGAMTIFVGGLYYLMARVALGAKLRVEIFLEALIAILLFFALSRTTLAMYAFGFILGPIIFKDSARIVFLIVLSVIAVIFSVGIDISYNPMEFRSYSTETRFDAYTLGLNYAMDRSVWFGVGYKPHSDEISIPIGSHSSFISYIVRGGIPGLILFFSAFYLFPLIRWIMQIPQLRELNHRQRKIAQFAFRFQILVWGWLPFQEVDTAAIASTLVFICLSLNMVLISRLLKARNQAETV